MKPSKINVIFSGFFKFFNIPCFKENLDCAKIFNVTMIPKLILLKKEFNINEKLKTKVDLDFRDPAGLVDDIQSIFKSDLKEILNKTVAQSSYNSRIRQKFPVFYLHNQVRLY
jgi:thiol-disulfide isomerase/thioredoxin